MRREKIEEEREETHPGHSLVLCECFLNNLGNTLSVKKKSEMFSSL